MLSSRSVNTPHTYTQGHLFSGADHHAAAATYLCLVALFTSLTHPSRSCLSPLQVLAFALLVPVAAVAEGLQVAGVWAKATAQLGTRRVATDLLLSGLFHYLNNEVGSGAAGTCMHGLRAVPQCGARAPPLCTSLPRPELLACAT